MKDFLAKLDDPRSYTKTSILFVQLRVTSWIVVIDAAQGTKTKGGHLAKSKA
jgi:hypothetical protein